MVANTLLALGYEPVWQDIFETSSEDIRPMLRRQIDSCSAVLQIVGDAFGAEPQTPDEIFGRVSYTQYETLYARSRARKVFYLIAQADMPRDATADVIDVAREDSDAGRSDAEERRRLQSEYRTGVQSTEHIHYPIQTYPQAELSVRRMTNELDKLRRGFRNWMISVSAALLMVVAGIGIIQYQQRIDRSRQSQERIAQQQEREKQQQERDAAEVARQQVKKAVEIEQEIAERLLNQLLTNKEITSEEARQRAIENCLPWSTYH